MILEAAFLVTGALVALVLLHLFFLAAVSLWPGAARVDPAESQAEDPLRFTILVPARDEEFVLGRTLASLQALEYPLAHLRIVVVADACSDQTAEVALEAGVEVLERDEPERSGKGHALGWALERLLPSDPAAAFVVVDADTVVEPHLLRVLHAHLARGARVVQAYYDVLDPGRSAAASLTWLGFTLSRRLKYAGRSRLGWSVGLLGNGMAFRREVLERVPWRAYSISEDLEYQLQLFLAGESVVFAPEARVRGAIPERWTAHQKQRERWDVGKARLRNRYAGRLLWRGLSRGDASAVDAFLELVEPPYAVLGALVLGGAAAVTLVPDLRGGQNAWLWGACVLAGFAYVVLGLVLGRAPARVCLNLACAPVLVLGRVWIAVTGPFRGGKRWAPTER